MLRFGSRWLPNAACTLLPLLMSPITLNFRNSSEHIVGNRVVPQMTARQPSPIAGRYEFAVCTATCGTRQSGVAFRIKLVLLGADLDLPRLSRSVRADVQRAYDVVLDHSAPPNACFVVEGVVDSANAPVPTRGFTRWRRFPSDSLRIDLVHGPDSGYFLQLDIRSDTATGSGNFWSAMHPERNTEKPLRGLRVGDGDIDTCLSAPRH